MREVIEYIIKKLEEEEQILSNNNQNISNIEENISRLEEYKVNPDTIDFEFLSRIISEEQKNSEEYTDASDYKGFYNSHSNESQIINALEYLKRLLDSKINEFKTEKIEVTTKTETATSSMSKYKEVKGVLESYNDQKYILQEELTSIDSVVDKMTLSDDIIKMYFRFAKNNSIIEKNRQINTENQNTHAVEDAQIQITEEVIRQMDDDRVSVIPTRESIVEELNKKREYLEKYNNFKNIRKEELSENERSMYEKIEKMLVDFENILNDCSEDELTIATFVEGPNGIELIPKYDTEIECKLSTDMALLNAYIQNEKEEINRIIELYNSNPIIVCINENKILEEAGFANYVDEKKKIESDYIKILEDSEKIKYFQSFSNQEPQYLNQNLRNIGVSKEDYYKYLIVKKYQEIEELIKSGNINRNKKIKIATLIELINSYKNELDQLEKDKSIGGV